MTESRQPELRTTARDRSSLIVERRAEQATVISGYAAVFYRAGDAGTEYEMWEDYRERILPGAFDDVLEDEKCVCLYNHDADRVLASVRANTLELSVDAKGLRYRAELPEVEYARAIATVIERGDVAGSSFAFSVGEQQWREVEGVFIREIVKVKNLWDVGPVVYPAFSATTTEIAKRAREQAKVELQRLRGKTRLTHSRLRLARLSAQRTDS